MPSFYEKNRLYVSRFSNETRRKQFLDNLNYKLMSNSTYRKECFDTFNNTKTLLRSSGYKVEDMYQLKEDISFYIYLKTFHNNS